MTSFRSAFGFVGSSCFFFFNLFLTVTMTEKRAFRQGNRSALHTFPVRDTGKVKVCLMT